MKTVRLIGIAFFAVLVSVIISACSKNEEDDEFEIDGKWSFNFDGQPVQPGEIIHIKHHSADYWFSWKNENGGKNEKTYMEICSGRVEYLKDRNNSLSFQAGPGLYKFVFFPDFEKEQIHYDTIFVQIEPVDLVGKIDIRGITGNYDYVNFEFIEGPFLQLYLDDEAQKLLIPNAGNVAPFYFEITSFGSDKETCYPSSKDWGWMTQMDWDGEHFHTLEGETFYGKVNYSKDVDYWFFKFNYGVYSHEIRKYKESEDCLWDGEWDN